MATAKGAMVNQDTASEPRTIDDVPDALRALGWADTAAEWELMQEVLSFYASDEDRTLRGRGEPYGSIPTEVGIKAWQHRKSFQRRESLAAADAGENGATDRSKDCGYADEPVAGKSEAHPDFGTLYAEHQGLVLSCPAIAPGLSLSDLCDVFYRAEASHVPNPLAGNPDLWPNTQGVKAVARTVACAVLDWKRQNTGR